MLQRRGAMMPFIMVEGLSLLDYLDPTKLRKKGGRTLLHCAALQGWLDAVELLITIKVYL